MKNNTPKVIKETIPININTNTPHKQKSFFSILKRAFFIVIGAFITAVGLQIFLVPNSLVDGGVVGIAIMLEAVTKVPMGIYIILINAPFLYFGYKNIGKSFTFSTAFANLALAFWVEYFLPIPAITGDFFLAAIFGGILVGIGCGIIMRARGSLDGTEIVAIILDKKTSYSVGEIVMFFNLFILGTAGFIFGWDKAMYSLVAYFVIAKVIDLVLRGFDESYATFIVSENPDKLAETLLFRLGRGVTFLEGTGAYTGTTKKIIYCVVTRLELQKLKEIVREEDENAFVTINNVQDIIGGRFKKRSIH